MPDFQLQHPRDISSMTEANPGYPHGDILPNYTLRAKERRFRPIVGAVAVRLSEHPLVFLCGCSPAVTLLLPLSGDGSPAGSRAYGVHWSRRSAQPQASAHSDGDQIALAEV